MDKLETKIEALKVQLESIQRAERYQQELEGRLPALRMELSRTAAVMDKEQREILDLKKWSLRDFFVEIIDKEELLEQEKEEYLQAAIAYREVKEELELLEFEIKVLRDKVATEPQVELELRKLYDLKQTEILSRQKDHPLGPVLEQLTRWKQLTRELEEAIIHGVNVQLLLEAIARHLIRAKNWTANPVNSPANALQLLAAEIDEARLRLPKLRLEFVKFRKEVEEVFQYPEFQGRQEDQWNGLRQVQDLTQDLTSFTQSLLRGLARSSSLAHPLHRTHTLVDNLSRRMVDQVKWLRLEQNRANDEISRLQKKREELLDED